MRYLSGIARRRLPRLQWSALVVLTATGCSAITGSDISSEEQAAAGVYSLVQVNGQGLPAAYTTTCEFPGTGMASRPGANRVLSGSIDLTTRDKSFTMRLSTEASCGPGHLVTATPTGGGNWKIESGRPNAVVLRGQGPPNVWGSFNGPGTANPLDAPLQSGRLTVSVSLGGASGGPVPVTLVFSR